MNTNFSVLEILETSWEITKKNIWIILGYSTIAILALVSVQLLSVYIMSIQNVFFNMLGLFSLLIINSMATLGFYKLIFRLIDHEEEDVQFMHVIPSWRNISSFISLSLLLGLLVTTITLIYAQSLKVTEIANMVQRIKGNDLYFTLVAGFAFFIILVISMRFMFFPCFIVDDDATSFQSLRQSRALTQDNLLKIIAVFAIVIGFIALGFIALGIGIIITYPFTNVILVVTYRQLVNNYNTEHPEGHIEKVGS